MSQQTNKEKLKSDLIGELIGADNWFAFVAGKESVKLFSYNDPCTPKRAIVTIMLQERNYAGMIVDAVNEYVQIMKKRELTNHISMN